MQAPIWFFLLAFVAGLGINYAWMRAASHWNIVDLPGARRLHKEKTVRGGGIGIALVMSACLFYLYSIRAYYPTSKLLLFSLFIIVGASIIGFLDDLVSLKPMAKIGIYLLFAVLVGLVLMNQLSADWRLIGFIAFALVVNINVWNFMDGSNGLITIQGLLVAFAYLALGKENPASSAYTIALVACCLAFLPFNFPSAHMFLGDVGSHALGAAVFCLYGLGLFEGSWTILELFLLSSALWIDVMLTFARRWIRGYQVAHAHRSHLYQYMIRTKFGHVSTAFLYAGWSVLCIMMILFSRQYVVSAQYIMIGSMLVSGVALHQFLRFTLIRSYRKKHL